jgi:hypothetical protein
MDTPTATAPTLDTTTKEFSKTRKIDRRDGEIWIDTGDFLTMSRTWRFISHRELNDGFANKFFVVSAVRITGGYTIEAYNPTDNDVLFVLYKLIFVDKDDIPIYDYILPSQVERHVSANSTDTYVGTFEIELDNIDVANQMTKMLLWGQASVSQ